MAPSPTVVYEYTLLAIPLTVTIDADLGQLLNVLVGTWRTRAEIRQFEETCTGIDPGTREQHARIVRDLDHILFYCVGNGTVAARQRAPPCARSPARDPGGNPRRLRF